MAVWCFVTWRYTQTTTWQFGILSHGGLPNPPRSDFINCWVAVWAKENLPAPSRSDEQLVPAKELSLYGKSNILLDLQKLQKNPIFHISVDILQNTNFFRAFFASANVPSIYIQQFWNTLTQEAKTGVYMFQLDEQWFTLTYDHLRDVLEITPVDLTNPFISPPAGEIVMDFVNELGYPEAIQSEYYKQYVEMAAHKVQAKECGKKKTTSKANKPVKTAPAKQSKTATAKQPKLKLVKEKSAKHTPPQKAGKGKRRTLSSKEASTGPSAQPQDDALVNIVRDSPSLVDAETDPEPMHDDFVAIMYPQVHESLKYPDEEHDQVENPLSLTGTLSSMNNLDAYTFGDHFFNEKPTKEETYKANIETKLESMVTVLIHQLSSSAHPLSTLVVDLSPPKHRHKLQDNTMQGISSRFFTLELRDLPQKINQTVNEVVKEADEFLAKKDKSRKRRRDNQDPPPPPLDSNLKKKRRHNSDASGLKQPLASQSSAWKTSDTREAPSSSSKQYIKTFERYDYAYLREIMICGVDYNDYKISEADFKNLHLNDFEDLDRNDQKKMLKEKEVHKFSDGTLTRVLYKLDHIVKGFRLFKYNPGMENRIWSEDDKRRSEEFMEVIERRLKIRRIFQSLERFVGGRFRDVDYMTLNITE
uniref:Monodehydroascorbate reductase n=1 Tax=Tanacetum cinerariifolium TaxID=118510 RepID=A0A6L2NHU8_TANCI|nr:hypothetical protein [Tanacetum cinerariifolium]